VDSVNFNSKQTRAYDKLDSEKKKLLTRLDSRQYTSILEAKLAELGVDTNALQSTYGMAKKDV
jgi:hypothetical protein